MWIGEISVREVATYVSYLPRGAMVYQWIGGASAITEEVEASWLVENAIYNSIWNANGQKGNAPKLRAYPEGLAAQAVKAARARRKAEQFMKKHG